MAGLLRAYRVLQTPPLQQAQLAGWLGITQGQLSRIERAITPAHDLAKLDRWSRLLHIPEHLLWFELSSDQPQINPPPLRRQLSWTNLTRTRTTTCADENSF